MTAKDGYPGLSQMVSRTISVWLLCKCLYFNLRSSLALFYLASKYSIAGPWGVGGL